MRFKTVGYFLIAGLFLTLISCGRKDLGTTTLSQPVELTNEQIAHLVTKKIFFGHQSVGNNIMDGIRDLASADRRLMLRIVKSDSPQSIPGPAFVEAEIGANANPQSKNEAFENVLARGMGAQGGIAMLKYCYIDIGPATDARQMFESYRKEIDSLKVKYPSLQIVHITVPLTTVEPAPKAWIKSVLGRATSQDANVKRNHFNQLLKQTYAGVDPIFDLAGIESTHVDGSRSYFSRNGETVYTLAPEYTTDGGHLNELGRRAAAAALLQTLAKL